MRVCFLHDFQLTAATAASHSLQSCQGGKLRTRGTRYTDLQVRDVEGEEVLLRHEFIASDVTTGLVPLGQLYQAGQKITGEGGDELFLVDPQNQAKMPVYYKNKNKSFASEHVFDKLKKEKMMIQAFLLFMLVLLFKCLQK